MTPTSTWYYSIAKTKEIHYPSVNSWQNALRPLLVSTAHALWEVLHRPSRHLRVQRSDGVEYRSEQLLFRGGCSTPWPFVDLLLDDVSHIFYGVDLRNIGRVCPLSSKREFLSV